MKEALFLKLEQESAWFRPLPTPEEAELSPQAPTSELQVSAIYYGRGHEGEAFNGTVQQLIEWIEEIRGDFFDLSVVVILSGVNLVSMQVNIPSKQAKHIAQALPFMLEDMVAEDVESLHIATGNRDKGGELPVVLCHKSHLHNLVSRFEELSIHVEYLVGDMGCLPCEEGVWHFLTDGRNLLVSIYGQSPLTIELDALPVLLNSLFVEGTETPEKILVTVSSDFKSDNLENWLKTQFTSHLADVQTQFEIEHVEITSFHYLCESILPALGNGPINLLQGDLKPISKRRPSMIKWKPVAALASVFVVFFLGFQYTYAWKLEEQARQADQEARSLYKKYFPQDRRIVDVRRQMKDKLEAASNQGAGKGFLVLLTMVGEKLNELNRSSGSPRLSPIRISFDEAQGDLKIDFLAGGFADLDALKAKLETLSLSVEIARASQDGDQMKARMNIRSAG